MRTLPVRDLDEILGNAESALSGLKGAHVFVTGATGFVGTWLCESLLWANERIDLGARVTALVRNPQRVPAAFAEAAATGGIEIAYGDVRSFRYEGKPDAIINAATPTTGHAENPQELIATIAEGAAHVLRFAARSGAIPLLFTSSGAIYGRQPPTLERMPETHAGAYDPLDTRYAYHEAKRFAETIHAAARDNAVVESKIARLFAFVGPYLPLDAHFAIGNFIRDAIAGGPIRIAGDGRPVRSYLYAADMTAWLWRILIDGTASRAYNVGSERCVSIEETAWAVADATDLARETVTIAKIPSQEPTQRYVPQTLRARTELGTSERVSLGDAIRRTVAWHCER